MSLEATPAFAEKVVYLERETLLKRVSADLMPVSENGKIVVYGCGHYGCVMPTKRDGIVLKVSSDRSEADFIRYAMQIGQWPEGIVRYYGLTYVDSTYYKRRVFFTWREEVEPFDANEILYSDRRKNQNERNLIEVLEELDIHKRASKKFRQDFSRDPKALNQVRKLEPLAWQRLADSMFFDEKLSGMARTGAFLDAVRATKLLALRLAIEMIAMQYVVTRMKKLKIGSSVAGAIEFYFDRGIVLADLHGYNIGFAKRGGNKKLIISDPGHSVRFGAIPTVRR